MGTRRARPSIAQWSRCDNSAHVQRAARGRAMSEATVPVRCAAEHGPARRSATSSTCGTKEFENAGPFCHRAFVSREQLIVFVKAPRPGTVKTRIARTAGAERACAIYRELVATVLQKFASIRGAQLRFAPDDAPEEIKPWLRNDWVAAPQGTGDLGERLQRAFAESFAGGAERVVIVGSDCPEVKSGDIRAAWKELKSNDLVLGPAIDGGYWLIGLRAPHPELFRAVTWSSDQVLGQTLAQAKSIGLRAQLLRILSDIDTEADWNAYVSERGSS